LLQLVIRYVLRFITVVICLVYLTLLDFNTT